MLLEVQRFIELVGLAATAGWVGDRVLDPGVRIRGIDLLAGLVGVMIGAWLWQMGGWPPGPAVGSQPIFPALAGTFAVCMLLKLAALGAAGPRW